MDRILHDEFVLVFGNGTVYTKPDLINGASEGKIVYEQQKEIDDSQKVRVWGDTAVVTAKLWLKGTNEGQTFRSKTLVQRYVHSHKRWLEVCIRTGFIGLT